MPDINIFAMYRGLLGILVSTYTIVRLIQFVWRWQAGSLGAPRSEALLRHWAEALLARTRLRRHTWEVLQITLLAAILTYMLWLQLRGSAGDERAAETTIRVARGVAAR